MASFSAARKDTLRGSQSLQTVLDSAEKLTNTGQFDQAYKLLENIIKQHPRNPYGWLGMAKLHYRMQKVFEAKEFSQRALSLAPDDPDCLGAHGSALAFHGDFEGAEFYLRKCLDLRPDRGATYYNLASVKKFTSAEDVDKIEYILKQKNHTNDNKVNLHFAAGKICDDVGDFDRAFHHFKKGNKFKKIKSNLPKRIARVERIKDIFKTEFISKFQATSSLSIKPIFIVGTPRSGTTLLEELLSRHTQVFGLGERQDIEEIANSLPTYSKTNTPFPECMIEFHPKFMMSVRAAYDSRISQISFGHHYIIDKMPYNFEMIGLIKCLFPEAIILHIRRHPLDALLSCYFQNFAIGNDYSYDLKTLAKFYKMYAAVMMHWKSELPGQVFDVFYSQLVSSRESIIGAVAAHIGLNWDDTLLSEAPTKRTVLTASSWQARQSVYTSSLGRAKNYLQHIEPLAELLKTEIAQFEKDESDSQVPSLAH